MLFLFPLLEFVSQILFPKRHPQRVKDDGAFHRTARVRMHRLIKKKMELLSDGKYLEVQAVRLYGFRDARKREVGEEYNDAKLFCKISKIICKFPTTCLYLPKLLQSDFLL